MAHATRTARPQTGEIEMGLDSVELIMAVEEAFDVEIADAEAEQVRTVGQMYALIVSKLAPSRSQRCMSSVLLYRTRRALIGLHDLPRRSVAPSTPMDRLLPARRRREHWRDLGYVLGAPLPELELSPRTSRLLSLLNLAVLFSCLTAFRLYSLPFAAGYLVACLYLLRAARRAAASFAVQLPADCATVGGTVKAILRRNYAEPLPGRRNWHPNEVWETLRRVVVDQLDVPPETVTPDADFVHDLGAD
jgi:acyl carrier protein